jgi:hypothetical protein
VKDKHVRIRGNIQGQIADMIMWNREKRNRRTIMTDLMALRSDMVNTEIVKQQWRSLWAEEQSLEARHVYQTGRQHMSYPCYSKIHSTNPRENDVSYNLELHPGMLWEPACLRLRTQKQIQSRISSSQDAPDESRGARTNLVTLRNNIFSNG